MNWTERHLASLRVRLVCRQATEPNGQWLGNVVMVWEIENAIAYLEHRQTRRKR